MPIPIELNSQTFDLSARVVRSSTIVASPADATETIVASITVTGDLAVTQAVGLEGWAAFTVGTNGTASNLKLRQTNVSGTTIAATGACTRTAANLVEQSVFGQDTSPVLPGQVYVLTLTVTGATVASTLTAVYLRAFVV